MSLVPSYDLAADALYLVAQPGAAVATSEELDPRVIVDRDEQGRAVGVELLGAARHGIPIGLLVGALGEGTTDAQEVGDLARGAIRESQHRS